MREIKFRAWDNGAKMYQTMAPMINIHTGEISNLPGRFILEQFTGLLDKNGKEIYEGDIVSQFIGKSYYTGPAVVKYTITEYHCGYYIRGLELGIERCETCEIIGNIHENPELLK